MLRNVLIGIGACFVLIIVIAVVAGSGGQKQGASPGASSAAPAAPAPASSSAAPPSPSPSAPFQSRTLLKVSGSGEYTTAKFTVAGNGDYDVYWTYSEGSFGQNVNFNFYADSYSDLNVTGPNQLGSGGSGVTHVYSDAGTHYLQIASEGDWTVKVVTAQ